MKVNFEITDFQFLHFAEKQIDLHNNFDFVGLEYNVAGREIVMNWEKTSGDWVNESDFSSLKLVHKKVTFFNVVGQEAGSSLTDDTCLGEITFFPSNERELIAGLMSYSKPNEGDDIKYFFENGQCIIIHCEEIELTNFQ